jgi:hypothetical protein
VAFAVLVHELNREVGLDFGRVALHLDGFGVVPVVLGVDVVVSGLVYRPEVVEPLSARPGRRPALTRETVEVPLADVAVAIARLPQFLGYRRRVLGEA